MSILRQEILFKLFSFKGISDPEKKWKESVWRVKMKSKYIVVKVMVVGT